MASGRRSTQPLLQRPQPWSMILLPALLLIPLLPAVSSYHDFSNVFYHCWWNNASANNSDPIECHGISIDWVQPPPVQVQAGSRFNVSYMISVDSNEFFDSMRAFPTSIYNMSAIEAERYCNTSLCPADQVASPDFKTKCCVWHANVHTCHPGACGQPVQLCGPWVSNDQQQSTHTKAIYGNINDMFSAEIWINKVQQNHMIAHVRVGEMQLAVQAIIDVIPPKFCGDGECSEETCSSCPVDCCPNQLPAWGVALVVMICMGLFILLVGVAIGVPAWTYYQRRKMFYDESWIIDYNEIRKDQGYGGFMGSMVSLRNMRYLSGENDSTGKSSNQSGAISDAHRRQLFTQTGIYEGRVVAIKKLSRDEFQLTNEVRSEVMQIRMLDHPNLCKFIGATVNSPNLAIINEYCPKGSLNDVLQNEDIPLNWGFRFSFASDIARGMTYLHQKRMYHGRLCSSNCVIDDRWVVKISDFGLPTLRYQDNLRNSEEGMEMRKQLSHIYCPPEMKGHRHDGALQVTPATDVYSFSIILLEIATRMDPYSEEMFVDAKCRPKLPDLSEQGCPCTEEYLELIDRCWSLNPTNRPSFDQIKKTINRINPNHQSPVDMMMIMMEKYSKHLELLVADRTQELIAEQKKTATLLYSMLPQQIADDLRQGRPTAAQQFRCVTVFFSDIVGFTSLASTSTPMEVVNMLNELYSQFDDILDKFDVYKVETIGDAYMVVSGVPKPNGDRHAGEIASMALQFLLACDRFKIPHRTNDKLRIRCGIHSGPVCAGVVGLKMPRYCLFGDTVNTAARMETTSEGMKIQCSDVTYQLLKKTGKFNLECRGSINVKGKGNMMTWWLMGKHEPGDSLPNVRQTTSSTSSIHSPNHITKQPPPNGNSHTSKLQHQLSTTSSSVCSDLLKSPQHQLITDSMVLPGTPEHAKD